MLLLSKYAALEYLLWIKNNKFNQDKYPQFYNELNDTNLSEIAIDSFKGGSKNLVYIFKIKDKQYILKQFRDLPKSKRNHFKNESSLLNSQKTGTFYPNAVFIDGINHIIIEDYLVGFKNVGNVLVKLIQAKQPKEDSIRKILEKIASALKEFHQDKVLSLLPSTVNQTNDTIPMAYQPNFHDYYPLYKLTENSFIHGDLNASNLLIDEAKNIKIIYWEMAGKGDKYYDLSMIVKIICVCSSSDFFFMSYGNSMMQNEQTIFLSIQNRVNIFLNAYNRQIDKKKLESFLVFNNSDGYRPQNKAFLTNIQALFKQ